MKKFRILFFRLVLAVILAVVLSYLFFNGVQPAKTATLAVIMFALAYLFEYTRKRDKE